MRGNDDVRIYGTAIVNEDIDLSGIIDAPKVVLSRIEAESASEMARMESADDTLFLSWSDDIEAVFYHEGFIPLPQFPHIRAQRDGECSCGGKGCLCTAASGTALLRKSGMKGYRELVSNPAGLEAVRESLRPMAAALSMAVQALSASKVVITGELSALPDSVFEHLQALVDSALPPSRHVPVERSKSGDKGAREGAAILALDEFFYHTRLLTKLSSIESLSSDFPNGI